MRQLRIPCFWVEGDPITAREELRTVWSMDGAGAQRIASLLVELFPDDATVVTFEQIARVMLGITTPEGMIPADKAEQFSDLVAMLRDERERIRDAFEADARGFALTTVSRPGEEGDAIPYIPSILASHRPVAGFARKESAVGEAAERRQMTMTLSKVNCIGDRLGIGEATRAITQRVLAALPEGDAL